jgi:hypothetical protein
MAVQKRLLWLAALLISAGPCGLSQDVKYNYDPGVDFSKFKTYQWAETNPDTHPDQLMDRQIKAAIDSQLAAKGLTRSDQGTIDMVVAYHIRLNQEKQIDAYAGPGWRWGGGMGTMTTSTINIGTLVFDMYDLASRQLVWKGYAQKTLNPSKNPEKNQQKLQKAVGKLLKSYPPKKK